MKYKREMAKKYKDYPAFKRFLDFKDAIKDTWVIACISCLRVLSTTAGRAISLEALKAELDQKPGNLYKACIQPQIIKFKDMRQKFLDSKGRLLLCSSCDNYLKVKNQMPPLNFNNGLQITDIPQDLELTDLEATLIAKRILCIYLLRNLEWALLNNLPF